MTRHSDALLLCPPQDDTNLYNLLRFKQALTAQFGIAEGFRIYRSMTGLTESARLEVRSITSLRTFASSFGLAFFERYPAGESFTIEPPVVVGEGDQRAVSGCGRSFFVACIGDARVASRSAFTVVGGSAIVDAEEEELSRVDDQFELDPDVFYSAGRSVWMIEGTHTEHLEIPEAFGSLVGPHYQSFGEWLSEYVPKYVLAVTSGMLPPVPILIDADMPTSHRQCLELMLPPGIDIIELPASRAVKVGRLWCAPALMYMPLLEKSFELHCFPPHRFAPVRAEMAKHAAAIRPSAIRDRVYLARPEYLRRKLLNRSAIEALVASRGFAIAYPEELDFSTQVGLVHNARLLIGPEGSAMFLNFFARHGTKLCILNHPFTLGLLDYTGLFEAAGIDVTVFTGPALKLNNGQEYPFFGLPAYADYEIDESKFSRFLDTWISGVD